MAPDTAAPIIACRHWVNDRQVPCPPMCPRQSWPRSIFRLNWRGRYVLRRRYRKADEVGPAEAARCAWAVFGVAAALLTVACCVAGWLIVGAFHSHRDLVIIVITVVWFRTIQLLFNATVRNDPDA